DDAASALRLELLDRRSHVVRGVFVELLERDVADLVAERERIRHCRNVNLGPRKGSFDWGRKTGARERDVHLRTRDTSKRVGDLIDRPATRGERINFDDDIALTNPSVLGWRAGVHCLDAHYVRLRVFRDQHPESTVAPAG